MIYVLLAFWVISAILAINEKKILGMIVYLGVFSMISAVCFLLLGAPDVAMAEAAVSTFSTVFLIICFEKYFSLVTTVNYEPPQENPIIAKLKKRGVAVAFTLVICALFIFFIPNSPANTFVKDKYIASFMNDVGGENSVTAIYLGYRMYDTLFEALMLLVSVVAVTHMSMFNESLPDNASQLRGVSKSDKIAIYTVRIVCSGILLFGIYLIFNGHISPGGGFQGGVAVASFFVCKYLIHNIDDMQYKTLMIVEKLIFAAIILLATSFILMGIHIHFPQMKQLYLILMNSLIGMKVACGFMVIFYRYIAFERR
ncbi:MAG: DUF4040 domain-containing protein [Oscillospiraceae bacterium]|nr:DUF4040 domain-containing protein [Oscillospiraceae bacterium]